MKKHYEIIGMNCDDCLNKVEKSLKLLPHITDVQIHLKPPGAVLTMSQSVDIDEVQEQIYKAGNYSIQEIENNIL